MAYDGTTYEFIFDCSPPALGNNVKITLTGDNVTLVLCHVVVETIGKLLKDSIVFFGPYVFVSEGKKKLIKLILHSLVSAFALIIFDKEVSQRDVRVFHSAILLRPVSFKNGREISFWGAALLVRVNKFVQCLT